LGSIQVADMPKDVVESRLREIEELAFREWQKDTSQVFYPTTESPIVLTCLVFPIKPYNKLLALRVLEWKQNSTFG